MKPAHGVHLKDFEVKWWFLTVFCAFLWSLNGGYINGIAYAGIWRAGLSHLTGTTTFSAIRFINPAKPGQYTQWDLFGFLLSWLFGAFVGGVVIGKPRVRWGRLQGCLTIIHGVALVLGWYFAPDPNANYLGVLGAMFVSFAMGLQNAITSLFAPAVIRTSHHSGTVLDIGMALGQCLHARSLEHMWKVKLLCITYAGFWIGALIGTISWNNLAHYSILVPAGITIIVGIGTVIGWTAGASCGGNKEPSYQRVEEGDVMPSYAHDQDVPLEAYRHDRQDVDFPVHQRYYGTS